MKLRARQPVGVRKREAAQHHAVDDAEHRRHAADAEREHDDWRAPKTSALSAAREGRCGCPDQLSLKALDT